MNRRSRLFIGILFLVGAIQGCASLQDSILEANSFQEVRDPNWPEGLFVSQYESLYWIRYHARELLIHRLDGPNAELVLSTTLYESVERLRLTAVTCDPTHRLFALFSGSQEAVIEIDLEERRVVGRWEGDVPGFAQEIWFLPARGDLLVIGQNSSLLVDMKNGNSRLFGPELHHGKYCCAYATAGVINDAIALNVDRGLRVYSEGREEELWVFPGSWYIREIASAGSTWVAIEAHVEGFASRLRFFRPGEGGFSTDETPLPGKDEWRITGFGDFAIAWTWNGRMLFRITEKDVFPINNPLEARQGRVVPGFSNDQVFLVNPDGYSLVRFHPN